MEYAVQCLVCESSVSMVIIQTMLSIQVDTHERVRMHTCAATPGFTSYSDQSHKPDLFSCFSPTPDFSVEVNGSIFGSGVQPSLPLLLTSSSILLLMLQNKLT